MEQITISFLLFGALLFTLFAGVHVALALGGVSIAFTLYYLGADALNMVPLRAFRAATSFEYTAIPLFIFMAAMLQRSGIAEALFVVMQKAFRYIRGGMAAGTIGVCTIFSCLAGISGAATISMGMIAVPEMLKRGYPKQIALGSVAAGGSLGILIPPSVTMIVYGVTSGTSIGRLYAAGFLPGLLIALLFVIYVVVYAYLKPDQHPPVGAVATVANDEPQKPVFFRGVVAPLALIIVILGSIFSGIASIGEAAALGALFSAFFAMHGKGKAFYREILPAACRETVSYTCMIFWIIILATCFSTFYTAIGASTLIEQMVLQLDLPPYVVLAAMMAILLLMGMVLDSVGIMLLTIPIFVPIANALGFDPVLFGILYIINMEIGFLTPPFGYNLFYLKGVAPPGVSMPDIYKSVVPFIGLMLLAMLICTIFPQIVLVMPNMLFG